MQWSVFQFRVFPVNIDSTDHNTASDWARKEILGAAVFREWVGENDEEMHLRGKLFPYYYAAALRNERGGVQIEPGVATIQLLDNMRKAGHVDLLVRGDGYQHGWFVIDRLSRASKSLGPDGIGREIDFEVVFTRIPRPSPQTYLSSLWPFLAPSTGAADNIAPELPGTSLQGGA